MIICVASAYPELFALVGARVPDFRGLFLRGHGGNSAALKVVQADEVGPHTHTVNLWKHNAGGGGIYAYPKFDGYDGAIGTRPNSGVETRPKNMAVRYLMRAHP